MDADIEVGRLFVELHNCYGDEDIATIKSLVKPYIKDYRDKDQTLDNVLWELWERNVISKYDLTLLEKIIEIVPGDNYNPNTSILQFKDNLAPGTLEFSDGDFQVEKFVGRSKEKKDCLKFLNGQEHDAPACLFLSGFPGVGKTRLAREICKSLQSSPEIIFLDLREIKDINSVVRNLVKKIDKRQRSYEMDTLEELIKGFQKEYVLVFDNAEDILNAEGTAGDFMECLFMLVKTGHPHYLKIIITSRFQNPLTAKRQNLTRKSHLQIHIEEKTLDRLNVKDSVQLMALYCGKAKIERQDSEEIAKLCGYCPFAMKLVACRLQNLAVKPRQMIKILKRSNKSLDRKKSAGVSRMGVMREVEYDPERRYFQDMKQCIEKAYLMVSEEDRRVLIMLSVIPGTFNTEAAAAVTGIRDAEMALNLQLLMYYNLVDVMEMSTQAQRSPSGVRSNVDRWRLHTLLRLFLAEVEKDESQEQLLKKAKANFVRYYAKIVKNISGSLDSDYTKAMRDQENEEANIFHFFSLQNEVPHKMVSSLDDPVTTANVVYLMELMINIPERLTYFQSRVKKAKADGLYCRYAIMRCWEALQYSSLGENVEVATTVLKDAYDHLMKLSKQDKMSPDGQLAFAHFYQIWGNVSVGNKDYATGIEMLKKSLSVRKHLFEGNPGKWGTILVRTLNDLGHAFYQSAQYSHKQRQTALKQAFYYQSEALKLREQLSKNHCDTIVMYMNLGACYHSMREYEKATDTYQKALDLDTELHLCTMNNRANILKNMALSLRYLDKFEDGFQLAEEAYEIKKDKDDLREPARCLYLCGLLQMEQGSYGEAEKYFNMQLELEEKLLMDGRPHSDDWKELQMKLSELCELTDKDIKFYSDRFENAEKGYENAVQNKRHLNLANRKRKRRISDSSSGSNDSESSNRPKNCFKGEIVPEINPAVFENKYFKILTKAEVFSTNKELSESLADDVPGIGKNPRLPVFQSRHSDPYYLPVEGDQRSVIEQAEAIQQQRNRPIARLKSSLMDLCCVQ